MHTWSHIVGWLTLFDHVHKNCIFYEHSCIINSCFGVTLKWEALQTLPPECFCLLPLTKVFRWCCRKWRLKCCNRQTPLQLNNVGIQFDITCGPLIVCTVCSHTVHLNVIRGSFTSSCSNTTCARLIELHRLAWYNYSTVGTLLKVFWKNKNRTHRA